MSFNKGRTAGISKRTIVLLALYGFGMGTLLTSFGAPLWVYYAVSPSIAPLVVYELRRAAAAEGRARPRGRF